MADAVTDEAAEKVYEKLHEGDERGAIALLFRNSPFPLVTAVQFVVSNRETSLPEFKNSLNSWVRDFKFMHRG
jgi:hypothetical protein